MGIPRVGRFAIRPPEALPDQYDSSAGRLVGGENTAAPGSRRTSPVRRRLRQPLLKALFRRPTPVDCGWANATRETLSPAAAQEPVLGWRQRWTRPAAHEGMTSATRSAATPMTRKSHPAVSVDPSDRANQPFMVIPTTASASAATVKRIGAA
jgi:hypothetical protein